MQSKLCLSATILAALVGVAGGSPAQAQYRDHPGYGREPAAYPAVRHRRDARMLPPGVRYRDPSVDLRPRGRPDFLIPAYLPRFTETPMYNEPPARFPQR